jgi:acyl carrier protein
VKLRGFRIELGEIEARLLQHAAIQKAVVIAREDTPGDKRLVAYYLALNHESIDPGQLRSHLAAALPEYMVPAAYVRLDALPLTPNGKLDRKALPAPEADAYTVRLYEAPQGKTENQLAAVWAEVLELDTVGRYDDFFELGGHSLLAIRVLSRLQQKLGVELTILDLFTHSVLTDLARKLDNSTRTVLLPITRARRGAQSASAHRVITAVGSNGHKIGSCDDTATWYDQTGKVIE